MRDQVLSSEVDFSDKNLINACYELLCWLAENKLLGKEEKK